MTSAARAPLRVAVFASGSGTTFQALLEFSRSETPQKWEVALLVTDRDRPGAVERAEAVGVAWIHVPVNGRDVADVERETLAILEESSVDLVALAGYLRLVPEGVVTRYDGRILNTHPSLLPAFGGQGMYGMRVHEAVVKAGVRVSGPTVHMVDRDYDRGRPLAQWPVPVLASDDAKALAARVQAVERTLYPRVVDHVVDALRADRPVGPYPMQGDTFTLNPSKKAAS